MTTATTVLLALLALVQSVAAGAARTRLLPLMLFIGSGAALLLATATGSAVPAVLGAVLGCLAPLAWSRTQDEFHALHHVVRLVLVAAVVGCFSWAHS